MFQLMIATKNDATQDPYHVAELVREVSEKITYGATRGTVVDYNGNAVGEWTYDLP